MSAPIALFCCYAHEDENDLKKLFQQLRALERAGLIRLWYDQAVQPGDDWEKAIDTYLNKAQIMLLIASASFIDSDHCYDKVMPHALTYQESGQARVLAVILHPCDWKVTPLGRLQALPTDSLPITLWSNQQSALLNVTEGVKRIAYELQVEGLLKAGEALSQAEQYDEALASFDEAFAIALPQEEPVVPLPILARLYQGKGDVYLNRERLAETQKDMLTEALMNYEKALHYNNSLLHSYEQKGCALFYLEQYEKALPTLEEALKRESLDPKVHLYKYETLLKLNRAAEALAFYEETQAQWAFRVEPHLKAAHLFEETGQFEQALAAWERIISLAPDQSEGYLGKTRVLECLERYEEALEIYEQTRSMHLDTEQLSLQKGLLLEILGRDQEAFSIFDEIGQTSSESEQKDIAGPAYFGKQRVYERLARKAQAQVQESGYRGSYRLFRTLRECKSGIRRLAFSPDGRFLACISDERRLRLWDASAGEELRTFSIDENSYGWTRPASISDFVFSSDGRSLIGTTDKTVKCWNLSSGDELHTFTTLTADDNYNIPIAFSPNGRFLANAVAETIKVWDLSSGSVRQVLRDTGPIKNLTFSPDGRFLASTVAETIKVWDLSSGSARQTFKHTYEYEVKNISFSLDSQLLVSIGGDVFSYELRIWDLSSGKILATDNGFSRITFSPDGRFLAYTFLGNNHIAVTELPSGDYYQSLWGHGNSVLKRDNSVYALAFSPNSRFLLGGCRDNTIRLWDLSSDLSHKEVQQTLYGHTADVNRLAFSPDGYTLASGSSDGIIKLWRWQ